MCINRAQYCFLNYYVSILCMFLCCLCSSPEAEQEAHLAKKKELSSEISHLTELCESITAQHPHLRFEYK